MFIWTQINAIFLLQAIIHSSQTIQPRHVKCRFWFFCAVARADGERRREFLGAGDGRSK